MRRTGLWQSTLLITLICTHIVPLRGKEGKLRVEDLLSRHLDAIGAAPTRAAAKTRVGGGKAEMREVVGGSRSVQGTAALFSDAHRLKVTIDFPGSPEYPGEQWVFDGNRTLVALTSAGARSALGDFLYQYPEIMREGLLGGSMFVSWPLLDMPGRQPKLSYQGLRKVGDRELHQLTYVPKKGGSNLEIRLYFEPETFRHVKTVYKLTLEPGMGSDATQHLDEVRYILEENFSDFQMVDGLTLPTRWNIRFEKQPSQTAVMEWNVKLERILHNMEL